MTPNSSSVLSVSYTHLYKSFTTLIPDENGKIVGSVCVNLDVSDLLNAQRALGAFVQYPMTHHAPTNDIDALATKNVDDILKYYMKQAELLVGKPMGLMNKEEKIRALDYLDQKGVCLLYTSKKRFGICSAAGSRPPERVRPLGGTTRL